MIVKQDDGRGGGRGRLAEHFAPVHDRRVEGAHRHDPYSDRSVPGVEHDDAELFHRDSSVLWKEVRGELTGGRQPGTFRQAAHERTPAQLDGGDDSWGSGRPHRRHVFQAVETEACQAVHAAGADSYETTEYTAATEALATTASP